MLVVRVVSGPSVRKGVREVDELMMDSSKYFSIMRLLYVFGSVMVLNCQGIGVVVVAPKMTACRN